jgi:UDP-N-acetylglucosamine--N-acetylmuramyl-(pentapeptide) pyrophosphoryl-undecaprenol N-acetylglucosamine transferase
MKILFTGGGTGGHILPIIATVRELRRGLSEEKMEFYYIGPKDPFGSILLSQEGIEIKRVMAGKIRRYLGFKSIFQNLIDIFKIPIGIIQAFAYIFHLAPDLIFSKGGYGSIPAVIAGWILQVPIFLHESDVCPGLANRFLSKFALEIFVSFPKTEYFSPQKIYLVGNPIRREILEGAPDVAKKMFNLSGEKPVILILGGSQGAQRINDLTFRILPQLLKDYELIHQCGEGNFKEMKVESKVIAKDLIKYYHLYPFLKELELRQAYAASTLIISRAGAGSIFEIAALGKPSILIPLPESAQNHQVKNAYSYAQSGACIVVEEENLIPHFFLDKLAGLFAQPEQLEKMSRKAKEFSKPKAAKTIAEYIVEYLTK